MDLENIMKRCSWSSAGLWARISSSHLIEIFQAKEGMLDSCRQLSQQVKQTKEPADTRFLVLRGLPFALCDNPTDFYKACFDSDDDYSFHHLDIGIILTEHEGDVLSSSLRLSPASLKEIL
ncbi:hypothetical protein G5714_019296 [Onychostoma macrolepis]|uniref:Uncharacterized protein n=1 Tax=Onychostoma macrolepis TaxID=369639 RepID=A0A7J6BW21_9TELE|nr:hypothetical protein G5714_019296 [Onychostoma macrolepis]